MSLIHCLYCGKEMPDDVDACPHCGAPSHFRSKGRRAADRQRFIVFFIVLVIFCFTMILLLPR